MQRQTERQTERQTDRVRMWYFENVIVNCKERKRGKERQAHREKREMETGGRERVRVTMKEGELREKECDSGERRENKRVRESKKKDKS